MSKRQHYELEGEGEDVATSPKRITPLNPSHSDQEALKALDKLSSYLGLDDLSAEGSAEGLEQTIIFGSQMRPIFDLTQSYHGRHRKSFYTYRCTETEARRSRNKHNFAFGGNYGSSFPISRICFSSSRSSSQLESP